jgi:hypothetical protein
MQKRTYWYMHKHAEKDVLVTELVEQRAKRCYNSTLTNTHTHTFTNTHIRTWTHICIYKETEKDILVIE